MTIVPNDKNYNEKNFDSKIFDSYDSIKLDQDSKEKLLQKIQATNPQSDQTQVHNKPKKRNTKLVFRLAPVLAVILIVTTVSCTNYFFSLRDLGLGKEELQIIDLPLPETETKTDSPPPQITEVDIIALSGVWNSPEYKACAEWEEFLQNYDQDGAIIASIGNEPTGFEESYDAYLCYTQEMADKIEGICEKYHLQKLSGIQIPDDYNTLCRIAGTGDIYGGTSEHVQLSDYGGYVYTDGTFQTEGSAAISVDSPCTTDFQFRRSMKGSFSPVALNVTDISQYRQWNYTTKTGDKVLLANSSDKALIIAERENSFVVVNVLGDILSGTFDISNEALEAMADAFDFSVIP